MKKWGLAVIVIAALVNPADAQEHKDPPPKPTPRAHARPDVHIDTQRIEEKARELEDRIRSIDFSDIEWRARELADHMEQDFDVEGLRLMAEDMGQWSQEHAEELARHSQEIAESVLE